MFLVLRLCQRCLGATASHGAWQGRAYTQPVSESDQAAGFAGHDTTFHGQGAAACAAAAPAIVPSFNHHP